MTLNLFQLLSLAPSGLWRRLIFTPETERVKNISPFSSFQISTRKKNITRNANRDRKKYFFFVLFCCSSCSSPDVPYFHLWEEGGCCCPVDYRFSFRVSTPKSTFDNWLAIQSSHLLAPPTFIHMWYLGVAGRSCVLLSCLVVSPHAYTNTTHTYIYICRLKKKSEKLFNFVTLIDV